MKGESKFCKLETCKQPFIPTANNQAYCTKECYRKDKGIEPKKKYKERQPKAEPAPAPVHLVMKPTPQQKEMANAIGIAITWIGHVNDLNTNQAIEKIADYLDPKVAKFELTDQEYASVLGAVLTIIQVIKLHPGKPEEEDNTVFAHAFKTEKIWTS